MDKIDQSDDVSMQEEPRSPLPDNAEARERENPLRPEDTATGSSPKPDRIDESDESMQLGDASSPAPDITDPKDDSSSLPPHNITGGLNPEWTAHFPESVPGTSLAQENVENPSTTPALLDEGASPSTDNKPPPVVITRKIPALQISRASVSSSIESLHNLQEDKSTLVVEVPQTKRKASKSPVKADIDDCNDEMSVEDEKPRNKKSTAGKLVSRKPKKEGSRSPNRSPNRSPGSSPNKSPRSPDKSKPPRSTKKDRSPKKSRSPQRRSRSKSPKDGIQRARSPIKEFIGNTLGALFKPKHDSETELLCTLTSDSDPPKPVVKKVKEKKAVEEWKFGEVPDDVDPVWDVNESETTCDSQSTTYTRPSVASLPDDMVPQEGNVEDVDEDPFDEPKNPQPT